MITVSPSRRWARTLPVTALVVAICMFMVAVDATAVAAPRRHARSTAASFQAPPVPRALSAAAALSTKTDHAFVSDARTLDSCLRENRRRPDRCNAARSAIQQAGRNLARAKRRLAQVAAAGSVHNATSALALRAPRLSVSGDRLTWTRVSHIDSYVLVREMPGRANQYSVIRGTSASPPPVPGITVNYSVRTAVNWSTWADWQHIVYPSATGSSSISSPPSIDPIPPASPTQPANPTSPANPSPAEDINPQAAPTISVSADTLSWNVVAGVKTYVLVSKVPSQAETYSVVNGNSTTPAAIPGVTVRYSVRTAVDGSEWAPEVAISYPAKPILPKEEKPVAPKEPTSPKESAPPEEPAPPKEEPAPKSPGFQPGVDSGWDLPEEPNGAAQIGVKIARVDFTIGASAAEIEKFILSYAEKGIRVAPLASFTGRMPSPTEARNVASWAMAYGPGGTFWAHRTDGNLAIQTIEFGNETSGGYQYGDEAGDSSYTARAETYAVRLREASEAIKATGMKVGVLAVGEDPTGDWMNGMFSAVPNLGSYVGGWVSHLYGPEWRIKLEDLINQSAAHGAPATIPIDVTEWGMAGENTTCVTEDYGWNPCMNYQETGETLRSSVGGIRKMLGSRLGLFIFYQLRDERNAGETQSPFYYFGVLQKDWQPKGAYTTAAEEILAE
jgi:hypothetical protein